MIANDSLGQITDSEAARPTPRLCQALGWSVEPQGTAIQSAPTLRDVARYLLCKARAGRGASRDQLGILYRQSAVQPWERASVPSDMEHLIAEDFPELVDVEGHPTRLDLIQAIHDTPDGRTSAEYIRIVEGLEGATPLRDFNWIHISHGYSDFLPFTELLETCGMMAERTEKVFTVYPVHASVSYQLRKKGYCVHEGHVYDEPAFERAVERALRNALARHQTNGFPILAIDDGGTIAKVLRERFRPEEILDPLVGKGRGVPLLNLVEITQNGHREVDALARSGYAGARQRDDGSLDLPFGFSSSARSEIKIKHLSPAFASTCQRKAAEVIRQAGLTLTSDQNGTIQVGVVGVGAMGLPLIADLVASSSRFHVTVYDRDPRALRGVAERLGLTGAVSLALSREEAIRGKALIWGMTGGPDGQGILSAADLPHLAHDAVVVQGSSKRKEFDMPSFEAACSEKQELPRNDGLAQRSFSYSFPGGKRIHFLADGWTINHDGALHGTRFSIVAKEQAVVAAQALSLAERAHPASCVTFHSAQPESAQQRDEIRALAGLGGMDLAPDIEGVPGFTPDGGGGSGCVAGGRRGVRGIRRRGRHRPSPFWRRPGPPSRPDLHSAEIWIDPA